MEDLILAITDLVFRVVSATSCCLWCLWLQPASSYISPRKWMRWLLLMQNVLLVMNGFVPSSIDIMRSSPSFLQDVQYHRSKSLWCCGRACFGLRWWTYVCESNLCGLCRLTWRKTLEFNLAPIDAGYVYLGPSTTNQNACRCSSVYYSLLCACSHCQGRDYLQWNLFSVDLGAP